MNAARLERFPGMEEASLRAASLTARAAREAVAARGRFTLALSGGTSPLRYFELLSGEALPWDKVHVFWADERLVAPDSPDSNYRLAREHLLSRAPIPEANVHPMRGVEWPNGHGGVVEKGGCPPGFLEDDAAAGQPDSAVAAAACYEVLLRQYFMGEHVPVFDVIHLGVGGDGHTASLFPGQPALGERARWVLPVRYAGASPPVARLTLTLPVLNAARLVFFLASGAAKARLAEAAVTGEGGGFPAALVRPAGQVHWLVGEA